MKLIGAVSFFLVIVSINAAAITSSENDFLEVKDPKKMALIIGQSKYDHLEEIPNVLEDVALMSKAFENLGFTVFKYTENDASTLVDLEDIAINPFRAKLNDGDIAVVYFSGHGFSYAGYNYFAPAKISKPLKNTEIPKEAILIEGLAETLNKKSPGAILVLVDACRTIGNFILDNEQLFSTKGPSDSKEIYHPPFYAFTIGFATSPGSAALYNPNKNEASFYTKQLASFLAKEDQEFVVLHKDVAEEVFESTKKTQLPMSVDWSFVHLYLNPSANLKAQEREKWLAALSTKSSDTIRRYVSKNATSSYAFSAKKWLKANSENEQILTFSRVSAIEMNNAWSHSQHTNSPVTVTALSTHSPVGYPRMVSARHLSNECVNSTIPNNDSSCQFNSSDVDDVAKRLLESKKIVTLSSTVGQIKPDKESRIDRIYSPNTRLSIEKIEKRPDSSVWLVAKDEKIPESNFSYIEITEEFANKFGSMIGRALAELNVSKRDTGLSGLIDSQELKNFMSNLKSQGHTVTWINIVSGAASTQQKQYELDEMIVHARYILSQIGIDTKIITSVQGVDDVGTDLISVRVFGY